MSITASAPRMTDELEIDVIELPYDPQEKVTNAVL